MHLNKNFKKALNLVNDLIGVEKLSLWIFVFIFWVFSEKQKILIINSVKIYECI